MQDLGNFCKAYYKKYGKILGETYLKEIIEINPSEDINSLREKELIGNLYISDPLCMNMVAGGERIAIETNNSAKPVIQYDLKGNLIATYSLQHKRVIIKANKKYHNTLWMMNI